MSRMFCSLKWNIDTCRSGGFQYEPASSHKGNQAPVAHPSLVASPCARSDVRTVQDPGEKCEFGEAH